MSNEADRLWADVENALRRRQGHCPLTPQEAQQELERLVPETMTGDEIDEIVGIVTGGELTSWTPMPDLQELAGVDTSDVAEDSLQLYRNPGEADPEVDDLIDRLREDAEEEDKDGEADENGLEGDPQPPGEGR